MIPTSKEPRETCSGVNRNEETNSSARLSHFSPRATWWRCPEGRLLQAFRSVQLLSCVQLIVTLWTEAHQASLFITSSQSLLKLMSISQWCHPTISSSVVPFSSCLQSFPTSGSFPMSQLFASGGQSTGPSTSTLVLPVNIQGWFPLGLTGLISLESKRLSRVFSSTTIRNHQFFSAQPSLWSSSHPHAWLLENHSSDYTDLCQNHQWTDKSDCQHSP